MRISKSWKANDGAALVEFAITIPILIFVVWCVIDFARAYYTSNSLSTAVREGARVAAVRQEPGSGASGTVIRNKVKTTFNAFGGPALTDGQIIITVTSVGGKPSQVEVKVQNYVWQTTTPINIISGGQIQMTRQAIFRVERDDSST